MKIPAIDQQLRPTWDWGAAYVLIAIPLLWLVRPWAWDMPFYSIIAAIILLPFLGVLSLYVPILFVASVIQNFTTQKQAVFRFLVAIALVAAIFLVSWICMGYQPLPSVFAAFGGFLAQMVIWETTSK